MGKLQASRERGRDRGVFGTLSNILDEAFSKNS